MTNRSLNVEEITLDAIGDLCWVLLDESVQSSSGPMRFPVLATTSNNTVDARVLVLRRVDKVGRTLEFHTDKRSAKISQIESDADMIWVFYDPVNKLQLRARGTGAICTNQTLIESRWRALNLHTQRAYAQELAPGKRVDAIHDGAPCAHVENAETGKANFAVGYSV